jgi:cytochrome c553
LRPRQLNAKMPLILCALILAWSSASGGDLDAGKALASTVCSACHGANGVSVGSRIPHLAGQRSAYLASQLEAFKAGTRKSALMAVIAPQLSADDVTNVSAYFAAQPGAAPDAKSPLPPDIANTHVSLPARLGPEYSRYLLKNYPEEKQVAIYYANSVAMRAAAAGNALPDGSEIFVEVYSAKLDSNKVPVTSSEGKYLPDQLQSLTGMARDVEWGETIPTILRNENWNYAVFKADRTRRSDINQAECLTCHKAKQSTSFLFMYGELASAARK